MEIWPVKNVPTVIRDEGGKIIPPDPPFDVHAYWTRELASARARKGAAVTALNVAQDDEVFAQQKLRELEPSANDKW